MKETINNFINGSFADSVSGELMDVYEPATGQVYTQLQVSNKEDINRAVQAAGNAHSGWSSLSPEQRSDWLLKIANAIEQQSEELAKFESLDTGKPISMARALDIPRAAANFRFFATAILHTSSQIHQTDERTFNYTNRNSIGVAGCISPWNLPLYLLTWKIAPALATGNCVVAKPSEIAPFTAFKLSRICQEIGLPPGVLNIVHGPGDPTGEALVSHPDVPVVSFTGGTKTGRQIASVAAPRFKKLSLELGGKNPNIIFDDCSFREALENTVRSSFSNQGQICLCGSRIFVQQKIYDKFKDALIELTSKLIIGDPMDENTKIGSLVSKAHFNKVMGYIELARQEGGKVILGGQRVTVEGRCKEGHFVSPTIIEGLDNRCRTNQEEIFGPVVTLIPFKDEQEVIELANDVDYGLSATIWTQNLERAHRVSRALKCGVVWVNCWLLRDLRTPFGGMKQSGVGREGGEEALRFFTEAQNVCIKV